MSYAERIVNMTITGVFQQNLRALGIEVQDNPAPVRGSTDFGLVSQTVPAVNAYIQIAPDSVAAHSPEFADASRSAAGDQGLLTSAKAMAMTVVDLIARPEIMKQAWDEFHGLMALRV